MITEMRRILRGITFVALLLVGLGCQQQQTSAGKAEPAQPKSKFAMNVVVSGVSFWIDTRETWEQIGKVHSDVQTFFGGPLDTDSDKQITEIEALLAKQVKGLVLAPTNSEALVPTIDRAVEAGVPVVTYLIDAPKSRRLAYVTSQLEESGQTIGEHAAEKRDFKGKAIISFAEAGNEEQERRAQGFKDVIAKYPDIELVGVIEDKYDENIGPQQLKPLLTKYPDVSFIFGCNSRSAVSAVVSLREMGFEAGKVMVTGWDYDKDVVNFIKEGWVEVSAAQQTAYMTQLAFSILQAHTKGYLYPPSLSWQQHGLRGMPEVISVPIIKVTKENADAFLRK